MSKFKIITVPDKCTGCLKCRLACSEHFTKSFNPDAARIDVILTGVDFTIEFSRDCNECGVCVDSCFYGALLKTPREEAA